MKEQLLLLLRLQAIDTRVREVRASMLALPQKLEADKQTLAKLEAMIEQEKNRLAETDAWRREQERQVAIEDEAIWKAKQKQQAARGAKDYTAANREVDNKRRSKADREDEVLKVLDVLEKARAELSAHEQDVAKLREHVEAEERRIAEQAGELETEIANRSIGRDELVAQIDPTIMKRYQPLIERKGLGIVPVDQGVCQGCNMSVPPQLNNVLARFDSLETCPRCRRILYRRELLDELSPATE